MKKTPRWVYPFTAIVGQEKTKLALLLTLIDPGLGGVLIAGPKGSGKSTIVRAMEDILPEVEYVDGCPYRCHPMNSTHMCSSCRERLIRDGNLAVARRHISLVELPISATEDGLIGAIDTEGAFQKGVKILRHGLLGKANQNILYIDGVNLLPDNLVNCILDPAASGWHKIQREGLSLAHPSRFNLIASMNPEEGALRPQILDRFALKSEMDSIKDPKKRKEVIRRNILFEEDPAAFVKDNEEEQTLLREKIMAARNVLKTVTVSERITQSIADTCSRLQAESLRSDIATVKAARALAAFEGRNTVETDDVAKVLEFALSHRISNDMKTWNTREEQSRKDSLSKEISRIYRETLEQGPSIIESPDRSIEIKHEGRLTGLSNPIRSIINILTMGGLFVFLGIFLSIFTFLVQIMFMGTSVSLLNKALAPGRIMFHLFFLTTTFVILNLLSSRRARRRVVYLHRYLGTGIEWQVVKQQDEPISEGSNVEEPSAIRTSRIVKIPLYSSIRRLYKMVVGKGAKLFQVISKEKEKRYNFQLVRRGDRRIRYPPGRQSSIMAKSERGRYVSYEFPKRRPWDIALEPTIRAAAPFQRSRDRRGLIKSELRGRKDQDQGETCSHDHSSTIRRKRIYDRLSNQLEKRGFQHGRHSVIKKR